MLLIQKNDVPGSCLKAYRVSEPVTKTSRHVKPATQSFLDLLTGLLLTILPCAAVGSEYDALSAELRWLNQEAIIYSATRSPEKVSDTAAAVYVLNNQDIRRSGATTIPEALRMVPGVQVAQINAHTWAVSVRGFNASAANKLLVMIDGRSVYHPTFSGTLWRTKDVLLEDVERIEVIRGPGASLWGANAVNGVINIITKLAKETQGVLAKGGGGNKEQVLGAGRFGGKIGDNLHYRVYVKYDQRDNLRLASGGDAGDNWEKFQTGFRLDGQLSKNDDVRLQGDLYKGAADNLRQMFSPIAPFEAAGNVGENFEGGNILARWEHRFSDSHDLSVQAYFDQTSDSSESDAFGDSSRALIRTYDFDFQHNFSLGSYHRLNWGLGYRYIKDNQTNAQNFAFFPAKRNYDIFSGFIQDQITLVPEQLKLLLGTKLEHNDFNGFQVQPNARLLFTPAEGHTVWASVARALRAPNRTEHDTRMFAGMPAPGVFAVLMGNEDFDAEELIAYELGYRFSPGQNLSFDVAAFYNDYDQLATAMLGQPSLTSTHGQPQLLIPIQFTNQARGETYGFEVAGQWRVLPGWRLEANYSLLKMNLHQPDTLATVQDDSFVEGESPQQQFNLHSALDLPHDIRLDTMLRYVGRLASHPVPDYVELDVNLAWKPVAWAELSVVGRNLLSDDHPEFIDQALATLPVRVQRSVFGQLRLEF